MPTPTIPIPKQPLFIIGDVHGMADQLQRALDYASTLNIPKLRIVFLGDLIDRGPDSLRCLQLAAQARQIAPCTYIAGNHEQFMFITIGGGPDSGVAQFNWRNNGGVWANALPLWELLESLELNLSAWRVSFKSGNCLCVHAGIPVKPTVTQLRRFLRQSILDLPEGNGRSFYHPLWLRGEFLESDHPCPGTFVFHGHTPHDFTGAAKAGRLNLDSGSFRTGIVTSALVQPSGEVKILAWSTAVCPAA